MTHADVVGFWRKPEHARSFAKDAAFDRQFCECCIDARASATQCDLDCWRETPDGALALLLLMDQFPPAMPSVATPTSTPPTRWHGTLRVRHGIVDI